MPVCEMCGYNGSLRQAIVEGSMLSLCQRCLQYGDAVPLNHPSKEEIEQKLTFRTRRFSHRSAEQEMIVQGYGNKIKKARTRMGITQDDVARAIAEKASVIQKVESGALEPPLKLAKKLEQFFKISLIKKQEKVSNEVVKEFNVKDDNVTIGDLIKLKRNS